MRYIRMYLFCQVDQQTNQARRLQRNNDELQQQVENLSVQVNHLQTRYAKHIYFHEKSYWNCDASDCG